MKQRKSILIVLSVLVVILLGLGGWYLLSDRQPPELTTVATYQAECGKAVTVEELVARAADRSSFELTLSGDGDLTDAVQVSDIYVNHKQVGSYTAIYTVTDQAGNRTEARGLVIVNPVKAKKIQLSSKELYLNGNQYATLTPTVTPKTWEGTVSWTSSDPNVATVSDGLVTWVAPGKCTITAKADKQKATCTVSCGGVTASSVRLDRSSVTLEVGAMTILQAETAPTNWNGEVTWKSSKPKIAKVKNGVVTALKPGKCKITAQAGDVKAVCTVTCTEKSLGTEWREWWQDITEGESHDSDH